MVKPLKGTLMKKMMTLLPLVILGLASGHAVAKGDPEAGAAKAKSCAVCHGPNGISRYDMRPNLAGQKAAYLVKQMNDFRNGKRDDAFMTAQAKVLSDQDIEDLAAYYESLRWK